MTTVNLVQLHKSYAGQVVLVESSLAIESGKSAVFVGPSGCGKTTTLNCIAGFEVPTSGKVLFNGEDVTELAPHQRNVAMVFQSALLYPHLSARRNIEMSLLAIKDGAEKKRRIDHVVDMLRIGPILDKRPSALSGGERQRVALAKATVRQPAVFLMDEPFSALDAALRQSLRSDMVHLQRQLGVTTVFVTHDQVEAMTMGDVIVVMDRGRIRQVGTPNEVYNHPANRFVAGFIGSPPMNFFEGTVGTTEAGPALHSPSGVFALPPALLQRAQGSGVSNANDGRAWLGVRAEHLKLVDDGFAGPSFAGTVYAVERLGKENVVILQTPSGVVRLLSGPDSHPALDSPVRVGMDMAQAFLFDR